MSEYITGPTTSLLNWHIGVPHHRVSVSLRRNTALFHLRGHFILPLRVLHIVYYLDSCGNFRFGLWLDLCSLLGGHNAALVFVDYCESVLFYICLFYFKVQLEV